MPAHMLSMMFPSIKPSFLISKMGFYNLDTVFNYNVVCCVLGVVKSVVLDLVCIMWFDFAL